MGQILKHSPLFSSFVAVLCIFTGVETYAQAVQPVAYSSPSWSSANSGSSWNGGWNGSGWGLTPTQGWRLGVTGSNTELGVTLNTVTPNSAAARAGLAPGDLIVTVGGDQVGLVDGKVFDIAEELNRHADSAGRVRLLVQQRRSGQLRLIPIQLDNQQAGLTGNLMIRNGALPADAVITIQLENVSRPYFIVRNGRQTLRAPAYSQGQVPFNIPFDPSYITPGDTYRVRAYVTAGSSTIFDTPQPPLVLTQGNPNRVDVYMAPTTFAFSGSPTTASTGAITAGYGNYDAVSQQIVAGYQRYLGRAPTTTELAAWQQMPDLTYRTNTLQLQFLGSQEYFDRIGNQNAAWIERVFVEIIGRVPTASELDQWNRRFAAVRYSRSELLNELVQASGR